MNLDNKYKKYLNNLLGFAYNYDPITNQIGILEIYLVLYINKNIKFIKYMNYKSSNTNVEEIIKFYDAKPLNYWWDEKLYKEDGIIRKKINKIDKI